ASLVQIVLDPNRRTISGLESLISKEWVFLTGYKSLIQRPGAPRYRVSQCPNTIMFMLFLDCVHQLIVQNPQSFEYTNMYLILLSDMQFVTENYKREMATRFECNKLHGSIRNPCYASHRELEPKISGHIAHMHFFYPLFLRHTKSTILKQTPEELLLWNALRN